MTAPFLVGHDLGGHFVTASAVTSVRPPAAVVVVDGSMAMPHDAARDWPAAVSSPEVLDIVTDRFGFGATGRTRTRAGASSTTSSPASVRTG